MKRIKLNQESGEVGNTYKVISISNSWAKFNYLLGSFSSQGLKNKLSIKMRGLFMTPIR